MTAKFRYPGAQPFNVEQTEIFKGRNGDIQAFLERIYLGQLIVLYSKSGLGKSSLLNAGIIPSIRQSDKLEPISLRFGAYTEDNLYTPLEICQAVFKEQSPLLDKIRPEEDQSLWYQLKSKQLADDNPRDYLFVFDQFEELFTYPEEQWMLFAQQLSELFYSTIPVRFREKMEHLLTQDPNYFDPEELQQFHHPVGIKVVIAVRFDRLALLDRLKPYFPNVMDDTYELTPLTYQQAEDAILLPAFQKGIFASPSFDYEDEAVERLLQFLSKNSTQPIESFQLQILCEYAEKQVIICNNASLVKFTDLIDPEQILENYYLNNISEIPIEKDRLAARKFIEEGLIFEEEERRMSLHEGQIYRMYQISPTLLRQLLDTHLIRSEPSMLGGYTYELSHDTLVAPVLKAKRLRMWAEKEAAEIEARQELEREKRKRRRANFIATLSILLALIATIASIYAFRLKSEAVAAQQEALRERANALKAQATTETTLNELKQEKAIALILDGDGFLQNDEYEFALNKYQDALKILPTNAASLQNAVQEKIKICQSKISNKQ